MRGHVIGLLVAGVLLAGSTTAASAAAPAGVQQVLDRAVTEGGLPGTIAEVRDGGRRWFGTAGVADLGTGRLRQQRDRFRIGSTTKTFVATVMLQLAAEHKVGLDDPVERWLPSVGTTATVRQLLGQTSGIFNYVQDPELLATYVGPAFMEHRFDSVTPEQLVRIAMAHPPVFEPGTDWAYSNTNYVLAGMIIERATGRTLATEVTRRIIRPLGLTGTSMPVGDDSSISGPHGRHYSKLLVPDPDARVYDVTEMNPSWGWGAGNMISTTDDLATYFRALLAGRLLPPAQQREMFTTVPTHGWLDNSTYGLGVASVTLSCGRTVWGMGGAIHGSWSYTFGIRDGRHVLTTNVNGDWANGPWHDPIGVFTDELEAEFCRAE